MSDKIAITEKNYLSPKLEPKRNACGNNTTSMSCRKRTQLEVPVAGRRRAVRARPRAGQTAHPEGGKAKAIKLKKDILAHGVPEDTRSGEDASISA